MSLPRRHIFESSCSTASGALKPKANFKCEDYSHRSSISQSALIYSDNNLPTQNIAREVIFSFLFDTTTATMKFNLGVAVLTLAVAADALLTNPFTQQGVKVNT
jgi:hypothetical protein